MVGPTTSSTKIVTLLPANLHLFAQQKKNRRRIRNAAWIDHRVRKSNAKKANVVSQHSLFEKSPRDYYKGKNCKSTGFHTRKGGYVVVNEKLPNYVVPDLTDFKLKPYVAQCPREATTAEATTQAS